jgi:hypothetical protein
MHPLAEIFARCGCEALYREGSLDICLNQTMIEMQVVSMRHFSAGRLERLHAPYSQSPSTCGSVTIKEGA